jgi:hypothetical protein
MARLATGKMWLTFSEFEDLVITNITSNSLWYTVPLEKSVNCDLTLDSMSCLIPQDNWDEPGLVFIDVLRSRYP